MTGTREGEKARADKQQPADRPLAGLLVRGLPGHPGGGYGRPEGVDLTLLRGPGSTSAAGIAFSMVRTL